MDACQTLGTRISASDTRRLAGNTCVGGIVAICPVWALICAFFFNTIPIAFITGKAGDFINTQFARAYARFALLRCFSFEIGVGTSQ